MSVLFKSLRNMFNENNCDKTKHIQSHRKRRYKHEKSKKTSASSNLTTVTTLDTLQHNCSDINKQNENHSNSSRSNKNVIQTNDCNVIMCISESSQGKYTTETVSSLDASIDFLSTNRNNATNEDKTKSFHQLSSIRNNLKADYELLLRKNKKLQFQHDQTKQVNDTLRESLLDLEQLNERLVSENSEVLHASIKNRFLKLESDDLTKKTSEYKQRLEEKENHIVKFQKQYESLKVKNNLAFKQREEALLEASHANLKLQELSKDCAELDIYRSENVQRRHYFNELQTLLGNTRVYLKVLPTNNKSCLSFMSDDKILINHSKLDNKSYNKKNKNLICRFTKVFQPQNSNVEIFEEIEPLLLTIIDGFNCSFITYGQTNSNKQTSLFGDDGNEKPGLVLESLKFFIKVIDESSNWSYKMFLSAVLIYRNSVFDIFKKDYVEISDDGSNLIMKSTEEYEIKTEIQAKILLNSIIKLKTNFCPRKNLTKSYSHLLIIVRLVGNCKMNEENTNGLAMFCETSDFSDDMELLVANRDNLKEEKILNTNLAELAKMLSRFKLNNLSSKNKRICRIPEPSCMLTKLLYPCFDYTSKCCLLIHCLSDVEQECNIVKTIKYGLMAMPKQKDELNSSNKKLLAFHKNKSVVWEFNDE